MPHVVFLDIGLSEVNGYEVARRLRREHTLCDVMLVALTGYGMATDRLRSREAGFDEHLVKPADPATVRSILTAVAGSRPA